MPTTRTNATVQRRYGWVAPIYDRANLEGPLYANARMRAIELLELQPGARVLDLACGTGANFASIEQRIGPAGELVGIDLTSQMLHQARARVLRHGWANVQLREVDICSLPGEHIGEPFDAALCTLGLSVIPQWQRAWDAMLALVRPGGRLAVMDAGYPDRERRSQLVLTRPFASLLSRLFAADCARRPWRSLQRDTEKHIAETFTWGWVTAAAGAKAAP
jgi:demethylmenaquinone methyltransferase/2-methoxy-6-polyprenyl-1,4-benzoquinol methylase